MTSAGGVKPGSSPLTRGKRQGTWLQDNVHGLIPAHAGKTSSPPSWEPGRAAHPRSRGENFLIVNVERKVDGSSPLTRGKHQTDRVRIHSRGLIPAHAGKTQQWPQPSASGAAHPRSRGENVIVSVLADTKRGSSPLTRGKLALHHLVVDQAGLIPAHAGKTGFTAAIRASPEAHPRSRGENLIRMARVWGPAGSSPLTRGKLCALRVNASVIGLIPAHAGKTHHAHPSGASCAAHPRSRGENVSPSCSGRSWSGSSPLTRGKHNRRPDRRDHTRLIPAHAGKTNLWFGVDSTSGAHPRSRGENCHGVADLEAGVGSSPLTRGKHDGLVADRGPRRLIPAHAGKTARPAATAMARTAHPRSRGENRPSPARRTSDAGLIPAHAGKTPPTSATFSLTKAHPRSRGENSVEAGRTIADAGSSPLTRGKLDRGGANLGSHRLIPAHAGKTLPASCAVPARTAHPRSRGENPSTVRDTYGFAGSSPLTRGKRDSVLLVESHRRLIPAHAGKTM